MDHEHTERIIEKLACHECGVTSGELELQAEVNRLRAALCDIAYSGHCIYQSGSDQYAIGVADGHRCAAKEAKKALGVPVHD